MGLGMPEVILILVIALIVFGPRKLPELGKSLGQAMSQFRRASDDFKRTWEQEVELEKVPPPANNAADTASTGDYTSTYSSDSYSYGYEPEYAPSETAEPAGSAAPPAQEAAAPPVEPAAQSAPEKPQWI